MIRRTLVSLVFALTLPMFTFAQDATVVDDVGHRLRYLTGGRFIQGTSGGERVLSRAFPLSTTGQFYGNAEEPAHVTWITKPFYLAETEVTVGQFKAFVADTKYKTSAERNETEMVGWDPTDPKLPLYKSYDFHRAAEFNWRNPGFAQSDNHPVVGISWADAQAYCQWLSKNEGQRYRLPTEAEWEFACRAGSTTWFSFGDVARGVVHRHGNLGNVELERFRKHAAERQWLLDWEHSPEDGYVFTAPVGSYQPNAWGLRDMHGNVWEWCEDRWLDTAYKEFRRPKYNLPTGVAIDPLNDDRSQTRTNDFHTIRGGSWFNGDLFCRSANRTYWDRDDAACYVGFRVARDVEPTLDITAAKTLRAEQAAIRQIKAAGGSIHSSRGLDIEVQFTGDAFDERALELLASLPELQRLRIGWRGGVLNNKNLSAISRLSRLESLTFDTSLDPDAVDLSRLAALKQLRILRFPRTAPLNDGHLEQLAGFTSLRGFRCYGVGGGLTNAGISQLRGNRGMESLEVFETEATGAFLSAFVGCPINTLAASSLVRGKGSLVDDESESLSQFPDLVALDLTGQTQLTGATLERISQRTKLRRLTLDGCTGIASEEFSILHRLQQLHELRLSNTQAGDIAATAIATIPRIATLKMANNELTDRGLASLAAAFSLRNVELASDAITDKGLHALGRMNRLDTLVVRSPRITGSGLGPVVALPGLRDLSLITSGLTDVAFGHLAGAKSLQKLRLAHRGHRPPAAITNIGILELAQATWLREIWLPRNGTGITEEQILRLNDLLPKTNVIPYTVQWKDE